MSIRKSILVTWTIRSWTVILGITCTHTHIHCVCVCAFYLSVFIWSLFHATCLRFLELHPVHGHVRRLQWCFLIMLVSCLILHVWRVFSMEHLGIHCSSSASASPFVRGRDAKPLGPRPDLTNDNCFTSRAAEGASRSKSHFETHSSKHFGPVLVGYSGERGSGAVKRRSVKFG